MWVDRVLDATDMTVPFILLSVFGAALCLYVMQKTWHDRVAMLDPPVLRWLRRASMALLALAICWSVQYMLRMEWKPWPPLVGIIAALDLLFSVRAVTLIWRSKPGRELQMSVIFPFPAKHASAKNAASHQR